MKKAIYKVPNGKLLKVFLEDSGGKIVSVRITGDFFAHPEENIEKLEGALAGVKLDPDELRKKIAAFLEESGTKLFGVDTESLVTTILNAM